MERGRDRPVGKGRKHVDVAGWAIRSGHEEFLTKTAPRKAEEIFELSPKKPGVPPITNSNGGKEHKTDREASTGTMQSEHDEHRDEDVSTGEPKDVKPGAAYVPVVDENVESIKDLTVETKIVGVIRQKVNSVQEAPDRKKFVKKTPDAYELESRLEKLGVDTEKRAWAVKALTSGTTEVEVARELHVSPKTLRRAIRDHNISQLDPTDVVAATKKALEERGPMKQIELCKATGYDHKVLNAYLPSGQVIVERLPNKSVIYRLENHDIQTANSAREQADHGFSEHVRLDEQGRWHAADGKVRDVDARLAGMELEARSYLRTALLSPKEDIWIRMTAGSTPQLNLVTNRDYGRGRLVNKRGEVKFQNGSFIIGKEYARWTAEVHQLAGGRLVGLTRPDKDVEEVKDVVIVVVDRQAGVPECTNDAISLPAHKVDDHGCISISIPGIDQSQFRVGDDYRGKLVFVDVKKEEGKLDVHETNDIQSSVIRSIDLASEQRPDNELRTGASGMISHNDIGYYLGPEFANRKVYVQKSTDSVQLGIYGDAACTELLRSVPLRSRTRSQSDPWHLVSSQGEISCKGRVGYVGKHLAGQKVYVRLHPNMQEADIFTDETCNEQVGYVSFQFDERNPVLSLEGASPAAKERLMALIKEEVVQLWEDRRKGKPISPIAAKLGLSYEDVEQVFKENGIGPIRKSMDDLKDFIEYYHHGGAIRSEIEDSLGRLEFQCENGHVFSREAFRVKDGVWCTDCFVAENLKREVECRAAAQELFGVKFEKKRPPWLQGFKGWPLELDIYNEDLGLAFEVNGRQHYEVDGYYCKTQADLDNLQKRDDRKVDICPKNGVTLIVIKFTVRNIKAFMAAECRARGITVPSLGNVD
jgi:hypothetical protein